MPLWRDIILGSTIVGILGLLGFERARSRRRMLRLADQLKSVATLDKLEIADNPSMSVLDRALNDAIQRTREQARILQFVPLAAPSGPMLDQFASADGTPRNVAVLAFGLRDQGSTPILSETHEQLREIASTVVAVAERRAALVQMQGSGTFALVFAAFSQEPAGRGIGVAYATAKELIGIYPELRFGLSAGTGMPCTLPGAGYTVIGPPLEEAIRLYRLAASWHEFQVLCPEPVSLILRSNVSGQRTPLQLTSSSAPPLPVYALDVTPNQTQEAVAIGA